MFPRAQTACSLIWACGEEIRPMNAGTAPPWTTALVWSDVPDAMLVRAQAASNCMGGESARLKKLTNLGIRPALMIRSIGGCLSLDSNFLHFNSTNHNMKNTWYKRIFLHMKMLSFRHYLAAWVAWTWISKLLLFTPFTISSTVQCGAWLKRTNILRCVIAKHELCKKIYHLPTWQFWLFSWRGEVASSGRMLTFLLFKIWSSFFALRSSTLTSILRRLSSYIQVFDIYMKHNCGTSESKQSISALFVVAACVLLTVASFPLFLNWVSRAVFSFAADILMAFD